MEIPSIYNQSGLNFRLSSFMVEDDSFDDSSSDDDSISNPESQRFQNDLLSRVRHLPPDLRQRYLDEIRTLAKGILTKLSEMKNGGYSAEEIERTAKVARSQLKEVAEEFLKRNETFNLLEAKNAHTFEKMNANIQNASINFDDFVPPPETEVDGFYAIRKANIEQNIALASLVAGTVRVGTTVAFEIGKFLLEDIDATEEICRLNPTSQTCKILQTIPQVPSSKAIVKSAFKTTCQVVETVAKETGITPLIEQAHQFFSKEPIALSQELKSQYGIPAEVSYQYAKDGFTVGTTLFPLGTVGAALKLPLGTAGIRVAEKIITESKIVNPSIPSLTVTDIIPSSTMKKKLAQSNYAKGLKNEASLIQNMVKQVPNFNLPNGFPSHLNQFFSQCEFFFFKNSKLGEKKGTLEGHLLYKPVGEGVLFLIKSRATSKAVHEKIGTYDLIKSTGLTSPERLEHIFENAVHFARARRYKNVLFAWDPEKFAFASLISKRSEEISQVGSLSTGLSSKPLTVVEIPVAPNLLAD